MLSVCFSLALSPLPSKILAGEGQPSRDFVYDSYADSVDRKLLSWARAPSSTHGFWTSLRPSVSVVSPLISLSGNSRPPSTMSPSVSGPVSFLHIDFVGCGVGNHPTGDFLPQPFLPIWTAPSWMDGIFHHRWFLPSSDIPSRRKMSKIWQPVHLVLLLITSSTARPPSTLIKILFKSITTLLIITMNSFYEVDSGSIEEYVDDAAYRLISAPLPGWYLNADIKTAFRDHAA